MGLTFQFATAAQIIFGCGTVKKVPELVSEKERDILVVSGAGRLHSGPLVQKLADSGHLVTTFTVSGEPKISDIAAGVELARKNKCSIVIGIGGGSVIDSAKAIAALIPNHGEITDYLEVIGKGKPLANNPVQCIAVPTTAGTGAEVTKNSVIHSPEHRVKVSLRSPKMYPAFAVIDPELTLTLPPGLTAFTGADALTHLFETFVSNQANPFIDGFCREGLTRISKSLLTAFKQGNNIEARENMAMASMLGGMALANVKLGAVHGFAGPMGGMFPAPHGAICARLLAPVTEANIQALKKSDNKLLLLKFEEGARILTQNNHATVDDGIVWVNKLTEILKIPGLSGFGISSSDFPELVLKAQKSSSMQGNPINLSEKELFGILEKSIG